MGRRKKLPAEPFELTAGPMLENGRCLSGHDEGELEVNDALPGERVMARHLFGRRFRGQAQVTEVLQASADRVPPRCPHFGICSACTLQHVGHAAQLRHKENVVLALLRETGGVEPASILEPLSADTWSYRRKARLSVRDVKAKERVLVGFRERDGRFVTDMSECHILREDVAEHIGALSGLLQDMESSASVPQIEIISGDENSALIFRHLVELPAPDLGKLADFARRTGLAVWLQSGGPATIRPLDGQQPVLAYRLPEFDVDFEFGPLDFVQVNGALNRAMVAQAIGLLDVDEDDRVLDLFCGLGNFTLPIARSCHTVTGVEGDEQLVSRARGNAARNGISNAGFIHADLYSEVAGLPAVRGLFNKILLDPPRSGAEQILPLVGQSNATRVVYVSCNPATLARDAGRLVKAHGFRLEAAGIMDMFPHTSHVEAMALFVRDGQGKNSP